MILAAECGGAIPRAIPPTRVRGRALSVASRLASRLLRKRSKSRPCPSHSRSKICVNARARARKPRARVDCRLVGVGWFIATAGNEYSGIVSHSPAVIKLYPDPRENSNHTENPIFIIVERIGRASERAPRGTARESYGGEIIRWGSLR